MYLHKARPEVAQDTRQGAAAEGRSQMELPACAQQPDEERVERAVRQLQGIVQKTLSRGIEEVGPVLLREFYDNDPELYRKNSVGKHASLRLLLDRCDSLRLPVRRSFIANALQLAVFSQRVPRSSAFHRLPPSHRIELMRLVQPERVELLATRAVDGEMSVRALREAVRSQVELSRSNRGRKASSVLVKGLRATLKQLRDPSSGRLRYRKQDLDELTEEELVDAQKMVDVLLKRIDELVKLMS